MPSPHNVVTKALANGTLKSQPCEVCGNEKAVAHHDDYNAPLDVRWLCRSHHAEWHRDHGPGDNRPTTMNRNDGHTYLGFRVPTSLREELTALGQESDRSVSWLMRRAIRDYLAAGAPGAR